MDTISSLSDIAYVIYSVNQDLSKYCLDDSGTATYRKWKELSKDERDQYTRAVKRRIDVPGVTPEQQHEEWLQSKVADGWVHGSVKDNEAKIHPCMVPYDQLPPTQRIKDVIFGNLVTNLHDFWENQTEFTVRVIRIIIESIITDCYEYQNVTTPNFKLHLAISLSRHIQTAIYGAYVDADEI